MPLGGDSAGEPGLQPRNVDAVAVPVRRVTPAHHLQPQALGLGEAAPHAVRFMRGERMGGTLRPDRAVPADLLGCRFTPAARGAALTVGVEELGAVPSPAGSLVLPLPDVRDGPRESAYVGHRFLRCGWFLARSPRSARCTPECHVT